MDSDQTSRVYLVEDDSLLRSWLGVELGTRGFDVASFDSGNRFLAALNSLAPGCVLSDLRMPDGNGLDVLEGLKSRPARFPVVIMSAYGDISIAVQAMKLGAVDFVVKPFTSDFIAGVVSSTQQRLRDSRDGRERSAADRAAKGCERLKLLTPRERDVLEGVCAGWTSRRIADDLGISQRTVELHRAHLMDKMGVRSVAELVRLRLLMADEGQPQLMGT